MGRDRRCADEFLMNLFEYSIPKSGEDFTTLLDTSKVKIVRIVSSDDLEPMEYIQDEDEWVAVLEGRAVLEMDGAEVVLSKGDTLFIPAQTPHKVLQTERGTLWLAAHILN